MVRHYRPITDYAPIDYHAHLNRIAVYFDWKLGELAAVFDRWKLRELEHDDCIALVDQLKRRLTGFALACNAMPLRTPRQLMATAIAITKDPEGFLDGSGSYDPEVVARVYDAIACASPGNQLLLAEFECGRGPPPSAEAVLTAARNVHTELELNAEEKSHRGRQTLELQRDLAVDLRRIFERFGGHAPRITRFDQHAEPMPQYREVGPFHDFLALVLPPAKLFARRAGFAMASIRSMVRMSKGGEIPASEPVSRKS